MEGLSEVAYPPTSDTLSRGDIAAIQLLADPSSSKRVHVPLNLRQGDIRVSVMGFFNTGSMTNLVDESFVKKHHLKLKKKYLPLKTSAFNGMAGEDIWWEWNGEIEARGSDDETETYEITLNVTRLSGHEVIIGYPWMGGVGCLMIMIETGTFFTLGHLLIAAVTEQMTPIVDCKLHTPIKISSISLSSLPLDRICTSALCPFISSPHPTDRADTDPHSNCCDIERVRIAAALRPGSTSTPRATTRCTRSTARRTSFTRRICVSSPSSSSTQNPSSTMSRPSSTTY